jgi:hypothetical protein
MLDLVDYSVSNGQALPVVITRYHPRTHSLATVSKLKTSCYKHIIILLIFDNTTIINLSSLLGLQSCVGLGFLHGFVTVNFSSVGSLATRPPPNLENYTSSHPYHLACLAYAALPGAYAAASIALRVIEACKPPLYNKAVVIEKGY